MTLFNDQYSKASFRILDEAKADGSIMKVLVPFVQSDEKNGNGRIYPRALMQREINRVQADISDGKFLGSADHPVGNTELKFVSHIVSKLSLDEKGTGWAELKLLDTTQGKNLKTILKSGGTLGISSRGFGTFDKETSMVKDDYMLTGLDIVANPSFSKGVFNQANIFESLSLSAPAQFSKSAGYSKEGYVVKTKIIEQLREDTEFSRVIKRLYEGEENYTGTLVEYAEENEIQVKAVLGVENNQFESYEEAFMKLRGGEQLIATGKKWDVNPDRPAEPIDYYEESKITGIDPIKRAEHVNKEREKPGLTERYIAMRKRVVLSGKIGQTAEQIDEMVQKLLKAEPAIHEKAKAKRLLMEDKAIKETQDKVKKDPYLGLKMEMNRIGILAGFSRAQIDESIKRRIEDKKRMEA